MLTLPSYRFVETIHRSSSSLVYRAFGEAEGRTVIIKSPAAAYPRPTEVATLEHEHEIGKSLDVRGVVKHLGLITQDKACALVLEDFGATSLGSHVAARGPLDVRRFLDVASAVTEALVAMHDAHVIHKDVSPGNILFNEATGEVKICDLGMASRLTREKQEYASPRLIEGTLAYTSPEQTGRMNRAIDHRSDLYGLGATFYTLLSGAPPFSARDEVELIHCHIAIAPKPLSEARPEIPAPISAIVDKLLAKNAEERYQSARGVAADLAECARRLREEDKIDAFPLARDDVSHRLQLSEKLYGREAQVAALLAAFEESAAGRPGVALVGGYSGVGKSAVVREVHKPIAARRGYFMHGKCEQGTQAPLTGFPQAIADLARQLLTEPESHLRRVRDDLYAALAGNGRLVVDLAPEMGLVLGEQPALVPLAPVEARDRFEATLVAFFLALAKTDHPLVLFIDDLQWADPASMRVWTRLAAHTGHGAAPILLIGAYRDNEVTPAHPIMTAIRELEERGVPLARIGLRALEERDVSALLEDTLRADAAAVAPLCRVIVEKTGGNPFFVTQLLDTLHHDGALRFDPDARRWAWDLARVQEIGVSANVVDLMVTKIRRYPERAQDLLRAASVLGTTFDLGTLSTTGGAGARAVAQDLWEPVKDGLVTPLDSRFHYYVWSRTEHEDAPPADEVRLRFAHDRIREAASSEVAAADRADLSLRMGRLLRDRLGASLRDERLFDVVRLLDGGRELITSPDERLELARMNIAAGERAKAATGYHAAVGYLEIALALLPDDAWERAHAEMFAIHRELIECWFLRGNQARAEELFAVAKAHARTREQVGDIYQLMIRICATASNMLEALRLGRECLKLFGVDLPTEPERIGAEIGALGARVAELTAGREVASLIDLPVMTDKDTAACLGLLHETWTAALMVGDMPQTVLTSLHTIILSITHGQTEFSACGYVAFGAVLSIQGHYGAAHEYGKLARAVNEKFKNPFVIPKVNNTFANFANHFANHIKTSVPIYTESYEYALRSGDRWWGAWGVAWVYTTRLIKGDPLRDVAEVGELYRPYIEASGYLPLLQKLEMEQHVVMNLEGRTEGRLTLSEGSFREEDIAPGFAKLSFEWAVHWYYSLRSLLLFLYREIDAALAASDEAHTRRDVIPNSPIYPDHFFYRSLILAASLARATPEEREARLAEIQSNADLVGRWVPTAPDNYRHRHLLLRAEIARVTGADAEAASLYEQAIAAARAASYLHHEAIANELAGEHQLALGRPKAAKGYLLEARYLYDRWGASAKVAALLERHGDLLAVPLAKPATEVREAGQSVRLGADQLDLATVMKAAQAVSGEIVLSRLLEQIVRIGMENAGAQRGVLLLAQGDRLLVEAAAVAGGEGWTRRSIPLEESGDLPESVIQYVRRTSTILTLDDAAESAHFRGDPFIAARGVRSILCLPVVRLGALRGILYLENAAVRAAFTPDRTRVLQLLATQAAISLENAELYDTLEQRVEARTSELQEKNDELARTLRDLRDAQDRMIVQSRLAALGSLTAGIAHELRNPLNFVNSFSIVTLDLAGEVSTEIGRLAGQIDPEIASNLEDLGRDMRQNLTKVVEHGERAARIISAMLMHARGATGERTETDLNALLRENVSLAYQGARTRDATFNVTLELDLDPTIAPMMLAGQEIARVFLNLVDNACGAAHARRRGAAPGFEPTVRVRTKDLGGEVEIRVIDNGAGIPRAIWGRVFDPFFTTKPAGEGTGLGLSISREIVEQGHGGALRFETREGEGTALIVTLPKR